MGQGRPGQGLQGRWGCVRSGREGGDRAVVRGYVKLSGHKRRWAVLWLCVRALAPAISIPHHAPAASPKPNRPAQTSFPHLAATLALPLWIRAKRMVEILLTNAR